MYKINLYATNNNVTTQSNGLVFATEVTSDVLASISLECFEVNYEKTKKSDVREIAGSILVDDNVYKETLNVVTDRYVISDFGNIQSNLIDVLKNNYKFVEIVTYEFEAFTSNYMMPFELQDYGIELNAGRKWFTLGMEKNNGKN